MCDACLTVYAHMFYETLFLNTFFSLFLSSHLSIYSIISQKLFSGHLPLPSKTCQISLWKVGGWETDEQEKERNCKIIWVGGAEID